MTISLGQSQTLTGTWKVTSIGVGGSQGDTGWWGTSVGSGDRACFFDDQYKFNSNGTFQNIQGSQTWVEGWQGGSDSCATPVAPFNGSNAATYTSNAGSLTLNGVGAYLGLAKAINGSEIGSLSAAPASVTYQIATLTSSSLTVDINVGSGWWRFVLAKQPDNAPVLTDFTFATQSMGTAPFTITPPTSNSTGAFTYTSSNTSVATISGDTITIVGIGSTTITANQAAIDSNGSGTISTTLDVSPPAAPDPTINRRKLVALYTDSYQAYPEVFASVDTYRTGWSAATLTPIVIGTNNTLKYSNLSYVGIEATSAPIDASLMNLFHVDIYTTNMTTFRVKLVDFGADGSYGGGDDKEHEISMTPTLNGWNSLNLLLSDFTGLTTKSHIAQIIFSGNPAGSGLVYVDNIYFGNQAITVAPLLSNFSVPTKQVGSADFTITAPTSNSTGAFTYTSSNTSVATISGATVHIVGEGTTTITATQAASGNYSVGSATASFVVTPILASAPTTAAPSPISRNAWDVKAVYSGAYSSSNLPNVELFPGWGQGTQFTEVQLGTSLDNTIKYSNLDYEGLNLVPNGDAPGTSVLGMTKLHIDVWTPDVSPFLFSLIDASGENSITLTPTLSGWNSYDITLGTDFSARNLATVRQMKFEKPGFAYHGETNSIYFDNIYFWRPETSLPSPTITNFSVPSKTVGDEAFTLTAPTSNSTGAFTYTSSNTDVATINGTTVTIVSGGSTIITATQAASGAYGSGILATTFVVSFPSPTVAAPTPTVPSDRVLSLYSNAYTNVSGTDWVPNWGQLTQVSNIQIAGNDTKKYEFMNYQGVQLANPIDVSSMTSMHIDIWTPNCTTFEVFLVNQALPAGEVGFSGEQSVSVSPNQSGWNSFDIPLSSYSNLELNHIQQLKLVATPFGTTTAYLDNIYFTKPTPTVVAPTVTSIVNLCKGTTPTPLTASVHSGNTLRWYTVGGTAIVPTYTIISTGAPSPATTTVASPSKTYAVSEVYSNGMESAKAKITVNVVALPTTPSTLTGTAAQGPLVGTTTTATYSTTEVAGASSYLWSVPTGVNIVSGQGTTSVVVNFNGVSEGAGTIGSISVQAVNVNGCNSLAKSLVLTKALPAAPAAIKMTDDSLPIPTSGIPTAVTSFAKYMGTSTVLTLTATPSATASSYVWDLPQGVNQLSGTNSNVITVNFLGVTTSNTSNYSTTAAVPVSTNVLRIGVKSRNGVGVSTTSNTALLNPTTTSTSKLLTLTAIAPAAPASVTLVDPNSSTPTTAVTVISKYVGTNASLTLTAAVSALASSYEWELPTGVNVVSGNPLTDRILTVNFNGIGQGVNSYYIGVKAKNGMGFSVSNNSLLAPSTTSTAKLLKVTTTLPSVVSVVTGQIAGLCGGSTYSYTITAPALASSYVVTAPTGAVVNFTSALTFTVTYPVGFVVNTATSVSNKSLVITSVNGVGNSATNKTLTLSTAMPAIASIVGGTTYSSCNQTFSVVAIPGAVSYTWSVPTGATIVSGHNTNSVVVNYGSLSGSQTIKVIATNGCGLSTAIKSVTLTSGNCPVTKQADTSLVSTEMSLYPNPAREEFNIELNAASEGQMEMTLFSMNGSMISSRNIQLTEGNNVINENISSLSTGVYFVKLTNTSNNETIVKKLIKE